MNLSWTSTSTISRVKPFNAHFTSCHPLDVKRGFIKGEAMRLIRTNSSAKTKFREFLFNFKLHSRGYPNNFKERSATRFKFDSRKNKNLTRKYCHLSLSTFQSSVHDLKQALNQPLLKNIFTKPPIVSHNR